MATTVKDIALAAGVSKAAVSKVLHNASTSVRVSAERAQQIRDLAKQMGYVPNANARILRQSRTNTIGVYFENLSGIAAGPLYTMHLLDGICRVLFARHYRVTLLSEMDDDGTVNSLADGRIDGVIWCKVIRDDATFRMIEECPIPIVAFNGPVRGPSHRGAVVRADHAGGLEAAIAHLADLGHRRILFLHEKIEESNSDCIDRRDGFLAAMKRNGLPVHDEDLASWSWNLDEFSAWWAAGPAATAVVAWSESCAGRFLERCQETGVDVPGELSVIGFDSTQYCDTTRPRLTAIRQPIAEMAVLASTILLDTLAGNPPSVLEHMLPCPLDVRQSTAVPRFAGVSQVD